MFAQLQLLLAGLNLCGVFVKLLSFIVGGENIPGKVHEVGCKAGLQCSSALSQGWQFSAQNLSIES